ncbi:protein Bre4p [Trichomonascus vanleenenianus]|uniref:Bre4p n=1 Tax=Trichomonascus vanleenenianus TaxID=2268995 RepID=UPI003EC9AF7F
MTQGDQEKDQRTPGTVCFETSGGTVCFEDSTPDREHGQSGDYFSIPRNEAVASSAVAARFHHLQPDRLTPQSSYERRPPLTPRGSAEAVPIYRGSYNKQSSTSLMSFFMHQDPHHMDPISGASSPRHSVISPNPKTSWSQFRMNKILGQEEGYRMTYGLEELRDGFFDAIFVKPTLLEVATRRAIEQGHLPEQQPPDVDRFSVRLRAGILQSIRRLLYEKDGQVLLKAFLAYLICYVLCLIGPTKQWLGRYSFFAPLAAVLNHSGRTVGSQLEITFESIIGMAFGLGWGSLTMYIASATSVSRSGYGGIYATSMIVALACFSWIRAHFIRMFHGVLTLCITVIFMNLAEISEVANWYKAKEFAVPYLIGFAVTVVVNIFVFPDTGHIGIMDRLLDVFDKSREVMAISMSNDDVIRHEAKRKLTVAALNLSSAFREMSCEFTLSTFATRQVLSLRNEMQVAISRLKTIPTPSTLFHVYYEDDFGDPVRVQGAEKEDGHAELISQLHEIFAAPVKALIEDAIGALKAGHAYITYMKVGKGSMESVAKDLKDSKQKLDEGLSHLSQATHNFLSKRRHELYEETIPQELLDIMLYIHYMFEATKNLATVVSTMNGFVEKKRSWRLSRPIYPFKRAFQKTTERITHDRGGESAAYYFQAKRDVDESFKQSYRLRDEIGNEKRNQKLTDAHGLRYKVWQTLHALQGYESRFALKSAIVCTILSLPAWLVSSREWYEAYNGWFSVIIAFTTMHPRVGGNAKDYLVRSLFCVSGSIWAGIANRAGYGNPYALAFLGSAFMIPAFYRFLLLNHPRSGILACFAFTLTSLGYDAKTRNIFTETWIRMVCLLVGLSVTTLISWIFWPFVARHEVRKQTAVMLSHVSQCYQSVTDRYLYRDETDELNELTLRMSEVREARMIQSLYALEKLLHSTLHEPRVRGTFDQAPYVALIHSCEVILQKISDARISSIYFNVYEMDKDLEATKQLSSLRRDSVASVIFIFYILSCSFRAKSQVPQYLPSAAMSRKVLFDAVAHLGDIHNHESEESLQKPEEEAKEKPGKGEEAKNRHRIWQLVHEAAFSRAFNDITEELEKVVAYAKYILGEQKI